MLKPACAAVHGLPTATHSFVPVAGKLAEILHPGKALSFAEFLKCFKIVERHNRLPGQSFGDFTKIMNDTEKRLILQTTAECKADSTKTQCNDAHVRYDGGSGSGSCHGGKCLHCDRPSSVAFRGNCTRHEIRAVTLFCRCIHCGAESRDAHVPCEDGKVHMSVKAYDLSLCCNCGLPLTDADAALHCDAHESSYQAERYRCKGCALDTRRHPDVRDCPNHGSGHSLSAAASTTILADRAAAISAAPTNALYVEVGGGVTVLAKKLRCRECHLIRPVNTVLSAHTSSKTAKKTGETKTYTYTYLELSHPREARCPRYVKRGNNCQISSTQWERCGDSCMCIGRYCDCAAAAHKRGSRISDHFRSVANDDDGSDTSLGDGDGE